MRKLSKLAFCFTLLAVLLITMSCGEEHKETGRLKIVTSFYPIYISTLNVVDGISGIEVVNLTDKRVGCLHDYQLTTDNMKTLATANVLIINGGGMEEFLDKVRKENPKLKIIDATKGADIEWLADEEGVNSHVWMNIHYNIEEVSKIAEQLAAIDSEHASFFNTNARLYEEKLLHLESEIHTLIDDLQTRDIVTFHEAFPYFAKEFHLNIVASIEATPGHSPNPQEIAEIIEKIKPLQRKVIFTEPQYSPEAAEMIAYETGAQIFTLDPIVTGEANKDAYIKAMQKNARTLREALK